MKGEESNTTRQLRRAGVIPVVKVNAPGQAVSVADALQAGGLPIVEIPFRSDAAEEAIRLLRTKRPDLTVGAGTILTKAQAERAIDAGAHFMVTPGFNPSIAEYCAEQDIEFMPGVNTPGEIEQAMALGLFMLKFFPAKTSGEVSAIKALQSVYPNTEFIPMGGVNTDNLATYLRLKNCPAVGGTWIAPSDLVESENYGEITRRAEEALEIAAGFDLAHVGINAGSSDEAKRIAEEFSIVFGFPVKEGNSSVFAGDGFEIMKKQGLGSHGHLAIHTNKVDVALGLLERRGIDVRPETVKEVDGSVRAVYLKPEVAGFAIHLLQR